MVYSYTYSNITYWLGKLQVSQNIAQFHEKKFQINEHRHSTDLKNALGARKTFFIRIPTY